MIADIDRPQETARRPRRIRVDFFERMDAVLRLATFTYDLSAYESARPARRIT